MRPCVKKEASGDTATVSPGWSCVETLDLTLPGLRRDKTRAPIADEPFSVRCSKKQENCARVARPSDKCLKSCMRTHPDSPCTSICRIDPDSGWCLGCKRSLEEIADWPMLTAGEKRDVLEQLEDR
jgi:predicted Fe-S protein YdhL (DUF1289 family)